MAFPMRYDGRNYFWNMFDRPNRLFDQNFGNGIQSEDLFTLPPSFYQWPTRRDFLRDLEKTGISEIKYDKDKYQVMLDVQHFKPEEITVTSRDNSVTIQGHHEEKQDDHGYISRSFTRRYILPDDVKVEHVECNLSTDGVLTLKAPRITAVKDDNARRIPIISTGQPAAAMKAQTKSSSSSSSYSAASSTSTTETKAAAAGTSTTAAAKK